MSDNMRCPPLQLGVLGFPDEPGERGLDGDGSNAIYQRWFALGASQTHPGGSASGSASASDPNLDSNLDSDPDRQPNVRFVTVALRAGSRMMVYHTEKLDACFSDEEMDQFGNKFAESFLGALVDGTHNVFTKQQPQQPWASS
jgi:hypothetical protein